jgi:hypothetical protein
MRLAVMATIVLLLATKAMDVWSTLRRIGNAADETNPLARKVMMGIGVKQGLLAVAVLALVIVQGAGIMAMRGGAALQAGYVLIGVPIAAVQFAVARCNLTGRDNFITRLVRRAHARMGC